MSERQTYQLYIRVGARWEWACDVAAGTHQEALRQAIACLPPHHYDKPIRLEQVTAAGDGDARRGERAADRAGDAGEHPYSN